MACLLSIDSAVVPAMNACFDMLQEEALLQFMFQHVTADEVIE